MRTPASTSARGSTMAVGCKPEPSVTGIFLELTHPFFQRAHLAHELRQHRLRGPDAAGGRGGGAGGGGGPPPPPPPPPAGAPGGGGGCAPPPPPAVRRRS